MNSILVIVLLAALMCAWAIWEVTRALRVSWQLRGTRIVTCPETGQPAAVAIDVRQAAASALADHAPRIRLRTCSRWTDRGRCEEACAADAVNPAKTARAIVEKAIKGQSCVLCRKIIERPAFLDHYSAFLQPDRTTIAWPDVAPERLQDAVLTQPVVCWDCHVAEVFRRTFPELVTDRPWRRL